eukprot:GHVQ01004127.1.p2 GENE.GHVQ01004127.1~~GHVQ01004127.1.p2  ORF type:complete len:162 (+),score=16.58 GHVQ01004127.1:120-605(+)
MAPKESVNKQAAAASSSVAAKVKKAQKTAKAVKTAHSKKSTKIRTSVKFRRPKTLTLPLSPTSVKRKVTRRPVPRLDAYSIIKCPLTTESAMKKVEEINTLVFLCDVRANKKQIKDTVKKLYDVKCQKVNTLIRPDGVKKAYVRLTSDYDALDVANKIGIL